MRLIVSMQQHVTHNLSPSPGARCGEFNVKTTSKKKLLSQATNLAWYQTTTSTFTHIQFFLMIIIVFAGHLGISRFPDIAVHNKHLMVLSKSLTLVTNAGHSYDKHPYLSSPYIKVRPFRNRPCHLNINAGLHSTFTLERLIILNGSVSDFPYPIHRISPLLLF